MVVVLGAGSIWEGSIEGLSKKEKELGHRQQCGDYGGGSKVVLVEESIKRINGDGIN